MTHEYRINQTSGYSRVKNRTYVVAKNIFFDTKIQVIKDQNDLLDNNK